MRRLCFVATLYPGADAIREYERLHMVGTTPAGVIAALRNSGIRGADIYRLGRQLVMILTVDDTFSMARAASLNRDKPVMQEWNAAIAALIEPGAHGMLWQEAATLFDLNAHQPEDDHA